MLRAGDLSAAESAAAEAIALRRRSLRGNYEGAAHGVMARAHSVATGRLVATPPKPLLPQRLR